MGMLVRGTWFDDDPLPRDQGGAFVRPDSSFRDRVTRDGSSGFKAERGRYQLVTAPSCPWAHRTVLMRKLKGLEAALPLLQSDLPKGEGWAYSRGFDELAPQDGVFHVHQIYTAARPDYTGRATVPVLWDRKTKTIVNNESSEIIRMLNAEFDEFGDASLDLYPDGLQGEIDEVNAFVYDAINNGVYRCGLAKSQAAYEAAFAKLFAALDELELSLGRRRWLVGERFSEADLRLFPTLVRFDTVYYVLFKCNLRRLTDYPSLWAYTRDIYQLPGVAETVDFPRIKQGYYGGMRHLNNGILPLGPALDFTAPHGRERLGPSG
ncbi:MAG TPA: glutathione S-transferase C-terminal domain-containing protein [Stellaceae bacterium]|nr:glutathione S-transferase C-terminal domain-containing protein [Stellaceae bacterium]